MTFSAFDNPFLSGLLSDPAIAALFTTEADLQAMLAFEAALASAQARHGLVPQAAATRIAEACRHFSPDIEALRQATTTDGVVVPALVRQLRNVVGATFCDHVHFGATSQDVIDTSLMLRLKAACSLLRQGLSTTAATMTGLEQRFGGHRLTAYTRMQAAIPVTVADRIRNWLEPLQRHARRLDALDAAGFSIQFGGAAGTLEKLADTATAVRASLAEELGLADHRQWHSQRDGLAEFASLLSLTTGSLGKFGQDVALMAQSGGEIGLAGGGGSSAMPHKQNPVAAEILVSLARFNAVQLSGMHQSMVHEQERSGAAWTLEWLILPPMVAATAASVKLAGELAGNIHSLGQTAE